MSDTKREFQLLSESEIDGGFLDDVIRKSIRDLQAGLCNTEAALLSIIDKDEVRPELWLASHECNVELMNLVKELISICKEFKPSSKALKIAKGELDEKVQDINQMDQS